MNFQEEVKRWIEIFQKRLCTEEDVRDAITDLLVFVVPNTEEKTVDL